MKVTALKQQVKNKSRFSVYLDEKYSFSLSQNGLLSSGLAIGDELNDADVEKFKQQSDEDKIYERLLNLLSIRPRSEWEILSYMQRKKVDPEIQSSLTKKLKDKNYINDEDFARRWVENRRLLKPTSKRKLFSELKVKRVPEEIIQKVLEQDDTDEQQVLKELIERKRRQTKYQDRDKLMQFLARQGFSYGDIKEALENN